MQQQEQQQAVVPAAARALAAGVAEAVLRHWELLPKTGKPQPHEHSVLAGIVAWREQQPAAAPAGGADQQQQLHVVAIGTGTKSLGGSKRSAAGDLINDSHAEVLARRAFVAWAYGQLALAAHEAAAGQQQQQQQQQQQGAPVGASAFCWCADSARFKLAGGVRFAMYVSQPPCGDASIFDEQQQQGPGAGGQAAGEALQPAEQQQQPGRTGAKLIRLAGTADVGQAVAALAADGDDSSAAAAAQAQMAPAPCVPCACDVEPGRQALGVLRRKPGKGDPTLSLSCSDKLARWACLGLQGCLLSRALDAPLHLDMLVVAAPATCDRSSSSSSSGGKAAGGEGGSVEAMPPAGPQAGVLAAVEAAGTRALSARVASCGALLAPPFALRPPVVVAVAPPGASAGLRSDAARKSPAGMSVNWSCQQPLLAALAPQAAAVRPSKAVAAGLHEVTASAGGRKSGASKATPSAKARSRLCSASLYEAWAALLRSMPQLLAGDSDAEAAAAVADGGAFSMARYRALKQRAGRGYQAAWQQLRQAPGSVFGAWLPKP